ncbi:MAG: solute carrier family 23 protein [Clostridium sp.]|uniref:solute carrier family 23 protein n=1 Tax=Clostridium sp. TaxID=1506 RepID=UPI003F3B7DA3
MTFTFLFVNFFGTVGSVLGLATKAGLVEKDGKFPRIGKALLADAVGTTSGAFLGTSAISTFIESSTGIAEGGKTGLTAFVVGCLFTVSLFFSPLFVAIPSCATAPALIYVGYLMLSIITSLDFTNITEALPAFITIILMPLSYSIGDGIIYGILSYVVINLIVNLFSKKINRVPINPILIVLAILFVIKLV